MIYIYTNIIDASNEVMFIAQASDDQRNIIIFQVACKLVTRRKYNRTRSF